MLVNVNRRIRPLLLCVCFGFPVLSHAMEVGIDASYNSSTQLDNWGIASHIQLISDSGYGIDVGYQYLDRISYEAFDTNVSHNISQLETALLWQSGTDNFRFQALAGTVFSNAEMTVDGEEAISPWTPGFKLGAGVSVPILTRFRAFTEADMQGWFDSEIPLHFNWRYGVRILFGGSSIRKLEAQERDEAEAEAEREQVAALKPPVTIDSSVPKYIPGYMSQSLPPILQQADLCKCYPAGPYTLQLGKFSNMNQAVRALEFRGLRQFFNSRAYQKSPQPVFLAQSEVNGPVNLFIGELGSVEQMTKWRHELRKNGIEARFRKVIGTAGTRTANPVVEMDEDSVKTGPRYTAEEIRRMNSLPEDDVATISSVMPDPAMAVTGTKTTDDIMEEKEQFDTQVAQRREQLNQAEQPKSSIDSVLQIGPLSLDRLQVILGSTAMKEVLGRRDNINIPGDLQLVWDEANHEGWLTFRDFATEQHIDEWQAWFNSTGYPPTRSEQPYQPVGDVYRFALAQPLEPFSVEIARDEQVQTMLQQMRAPEVLWFQAYQRINDKPVETSLNWSQTDQRFHLIVTNVTNKAEQQQIWANLNAVGLLPSLAEE